MIPHQPPTDPATPGSSPTLLNVRQASAHLGLSESTVWRMLRRGTLASLRSGGRRLILLEALDSLSKQQETPMSPPSLGPDHPIFRLVGAGRSGGQGPGSQDKYSILDS